METSARNEATENPLARENRALQYQSGFGNEFATEALVGALPVGQNSPQRAPYGLYAEQLSGTAFTAPRGANRRSWLYRIRPAAIHGSFERIEHERIADRFDDIESPPNQLRWNPLPLPPQATDFVQGMMTILFSVMLLPPLLHEVGGMAGLRAHVPERMLSLVAVS